MTLEEMRKAENMSGWRRLLCLLLVAGGGCADQGPPESEAPPQLHLFLLAGQSNMAGRGEVTPARRQPIPGVLALQQDGSWAPAVDPLHWDKKVAGVGLARSFARAYMAAHPGVHVGFIPAACGGSTIASWTRGHYYAPTRSHPYDDALARVAQVRHRGMLKGILWHQGEADAHPERVSFYEARLSEVLASLRRDLGEENLPVLIGQLGRFPGKRWSESREQIDAIHQAVARADPHAGFVSSVGLTGKEDLLHFDAAGLDEFGRRYAGAWQELMAARTR